MEISDEQEVKNTLTFVTSGENEKYTLGDPNRELPSESSILFKSEEDFKEFLQLPMKMEVDPLLENGDKNIPREFVKHVKPEREFPGQDHKIKNLSSSPRQSNSLSEVDLVKGMNENSSDQFDEGNVDFPSKGSSENQQQVCKYGGQEEDQTTNKTPISSSLSSERIGNTAKTGSRKCICVECKLMFINEKFLNQHLLNHTGELPFLCEDCGKRFRNESNLGQHSKIHSDIRRFSCDVCSKAFKMKHHLRQHMAVHGMESTPKYSRRGRKNSR